MRPNPLREWRQTRNKTALYVAKQIGVTEQTVFSWELGRFQPSPERLEKLAALVGLSSSQLRLNWHFWRANGFNGS